MRTSKRMKSAKDADARGRFKAKRQGLFTTPYQAAESIVVFYQAISSATFYRGDKVTMDFIEHRLQVRFLFTLFG